MGNTESHQIQQPQQQPPQQPQVSNTPQGDSYSDASQKCQGLNNDHIAYITKQYITILNAIDVINSVKNGDPVDPSSSLIDTSFVLADLRYVNPQTGQPVPLQSTISIFGDETKVVNIVNGISKLKYNTILDKYNDFFLNDYTSTDLSDSEKVSLASKLLKGLNSASANAIGILRSNCS